MLGNFPSLDDKLEAQSDAVMMSSKGKLPSEGPASSVPASSLLGKTMSLGQWAGHPAQTHPQQMLKPTLPHTHTSCTHMHNANDDNADNDNADDDNADNDNADDDNADNDNADDDNADKHGPDEGML